MITVVLPFSHKDQQYAQSMLAWIEALGGARSHHLLLVSGGDTPGKWLDALQQHGARVFSGCDLLSVQVPQGKQYHPWAPSLMFLKTAEFVYHHTKTPWQWLEPDMIPLKPGAFDALEAEYLATAKPVLGTIIWPGEKRAHVTGCALYNREAWCWMQEYESANLDIPMDSDLGMAKHLLSITKHTESYHHLHVHRDQTVVKQVTNPGRQVAFSAVRENALFFHYDKTHSLLPLLREKLNLKP